MKKLLLALVVVALIAAPAFASVQNIKISGSVASDFVYRSNYDFGGQAVNDEKQSVFRSQAVIQLDANLTDNVDATIQLMNERIWDAVATTADDTNIDLNLAYVTLREMLYSPMTVTIGRQKIAYGTKLILDGGSSGTASSGWTDITDCSAMDGFDAIKFSFDYSPLTFDVFYAMIDETQTTLTAAQTDTFLAGIYSTYKFGDEKNSLLESYFITKQTRSETNRVTNNTVHTLGMRGQTNIIDAMTVSLEVAHQGGTYPIVAGNNKTRDAWAVQLGATYMLPVLEKYVPVLSYSFSHLTGDSSFGNAANLDDDFTGWDPLYEGQVPARIINRIYNSSNSFCNIISLQVSPIQDLTTKLTFAKLWLDKETQNATSATLLTSPDDAIGAFTTVPTNVGERQLGFEIDLDNTYQYTEDVQFALGFGIYQPGAVFKYQDAAKEVIGSVKVSF